MVRQVLNTVKSVNADTLTARPQDCFHGPAYGPDLELLQNTSSPHEHECACLNVTLCRSGLSPASAKVFRRLMATGQDHPPLTAPEFRSWGGKPGSGGHLLTLTATGRVVAYAYFNDRSDTYDDALIKRQIPATDAGIKGQIGAMLGQ